MAQSKSPAVSPARQSAPTLVLLVAAVLTAASVFPFFAPWAVPAWLGVVVASMLAIPPALSGPKDAAGFPTALGAGESAAKERFALWRTLKTTLWGSHDGWNPTKQVRLSFIYAVAVFVAAGSWPLWDMVVAWGAWVPWVNAACAALLVAGVDAAWRSARQPQDPCPGASAADVFASEYRVAAVIAGGVTTVVVGGGVWWLLAVREFIPDNVVLSWGPIPLAVAGGLAAGVGVAHLVVRTGALEPWRDQVAARAMWDGRWLQSKAFVKTPPVLVKHTRVGPAAVDVFEIPAVVGDAQSFVLSHSRSVTGLLGGGQVAVVMMVPNVDPRDGSDVAGTTHPTRVKVASWAEGDMPDVCAPDTPTDVAMLLLECGVTRAVMGFNPAWVRPVWIGATDVAVPPAPVVDDEPDEAHELEALRHAGRRAPAAAPEGFDLDDLDTAPTTVDAGTSTTESGFAAWWAGVQARFRGDDTDGSQPTTVEPPQQAPTATPGGPQVPHVWCVELATTTISVGWNHLRGELIGGLHDVFGTDVVVGRRAPERLYVGPAFHVDLADSMPRPDAYAKVPPHQFLSDLAEEAQWDTRWGSVTGVGVNFPTPQFTVRDSSRLAAGVEINYLPFLTRNGEPAEQLFNAKAEANMATGLRASPFTSIQPYPRNRKRHDGSRNPQALAVVWASQPVPQSPSKIAPPPSGRVELKSAQMLVLRAQLDRGFDAAKLARPEVVNAQALTRPSSREHVWQLRVRLFGGVTLDGLRRAEGKLIGAMSVPWLRLSPDKTDGFVNVFVGEPARATFVDEEASRKLVASLDWAQAFAESNIFGANGRVPQLTDHHTLEHNDKVEVVDFDLPTPVSVERIKGAKAKLSAAAGKLYLDIRTGSGGAQTAQITCCVEDPMPSSAPFSWETMDASAKSGHGGIAFATNVEGAPVLWNPKESPQLLVAGSTGTGKSVLMQALLTGAVLNGWDTYVVDPSKGAADFQFMKPYAKAIAVDVFTSAGVVEAVYAEVKRRKSVNAQHGVGSYRNLPEDIRPPHLMLMIDEFTSLMTADPVGKPSDNLELEAQRAKTIAENEARARLGSAVGRIAREARSAGVSLVLGTQKMSAAMMADIPGAADLKANLARILLGNTTYGDRQSGLRDADACPDLGEVIPAGRGVYEPSSSKAGLIQAWYDPAEQDMMATELANRVQPLAESSRLDVTQFERRTDNGLESLLGEEDDLFDDKAGGVAPDAVEDLGAVDFDFDPTEFGLDEVASVSTPPAAAGVPESAPAFDFDAEMDAALVEDPAGTLLVVCGIGADGWKLPASVNVLRLDESQSMGERMNAVRESVAGMTEVVWADRALGDADPVFGGRFADTVVELATAAQWSVVVDPSEDGTHELGEVGVTVTSAAAPESEAIEVKSAGPAAAEVEPEPAVEPKRKQPPAIAGLWGDAEADEF